MFEQSLLFNAATPEPDHNPFVSWQKLFKKEYLFIFLTLSGVISSTWGVWRLKDLGNGALAQDSVLEVVPTPPPIFVDVSGAVENPGIYQVQAEDRMIAAIKAAGGLSSLADPAFVNTTFNLSAKITDGQKIYIPFAGESAAITADRDSVSNVAASTFDSMSLISINKASVQVLDELPKVGPATAQKIIDARPYSSIEELLSKKVLSQSVFDEIEQLIAL